MKKVIIDFTKWRSGSVSRPSQATGKGDTKLRNKQGFMCCLGFDCQQLGGLTDNEINNIGAPGGTGKVIDPLSKKGEYGENVYSTGFSEQAIAINDSPDYTIAQRMEKLIALHHENNIELQFINTPA